MKKTKTKRVQARTDKNTDKVKLTLDALRPVSTDELSQVSAGLMISA